MTSDTEAIEEFTSQEYKYGFYTDVEADSLPPGLNEDTVRSLSAIKGEPEFMLEWRLRALEKWRELEEPTHWPMLKYTPVDYQKISYYSAPKQAEAIKSLDEVDPEILKTYEKLGIP